MEIIYTDHARTRMGQKGLTEPEVEQVIRNPMILRKQGNLRSAFGQVNRRTFKVVYVEEENYLRVITIRGTL